MRLRYAPEAQEQLVSLSTYFKLQNPSAATRILTHIRAAAERLTKFPHLGRIGRVAGTYAWTVSGLPYVLVYEL